tara:strand:+ start:445 stop:795 length:351 start_codon:yes stop_codon:yes gene_type:complete
MALDTTGRLGALDNAGDAVLRDVYTVPVGRAASVNITIANRADTDTNIRIAHIKNGVAAGVSNEDYLLFDLPTGSLASNFAPIQLTGVMMETGDTIAVYTSASAVSVQVNGIEEDA